MISPHDFLNLVLLPSLKRLARYDYRMDSSEARDLLLGTALYESGGLSAIKQVGGPALGPYQMEPATHNDIWRNYLQRKQKLSRFVWKLSCTYSSPIPDSSQLAGNWLYATGMARVQYWRVTSDPIPFTLVEQAAYWKKFYNTEKGKGKIEDYIKAWEIYKEES